jgi:hypothetical protein
MKVSLVSLLPLVSFILGAVADNVIQIGCITISGVPADVVLLKYDYENFDTDRDQADQCGVSRTTWRSADGNLADLTPRDRSTAVPRDICTATCGR